MEGEADASTYTRAPNALKDFPEQDKREWSKRGVPGQARESSMRLEWINGVFMRIALLDCYRVTIRWPCFSVKKFVLPVLKKKPCIPDESIDVYVNNII